MDQGSSIATLSITKTLTEASLVIRIIWDALIAILYEAWLSCQ
jgi:hypothetical protein